MAGRDILSWFQQRREAAAFKAFVAHVTRRKRKPSDQQLYIVAAKAPYRPHRLQAIDLIQDPTLHASLGTRGAADFAGLDGADWKAECGRSLSRLSTAELEEIVTDTGRVDLRSLASAGHDARARRNDRRQGLVAGPERRAEKQRLQLELERRRREELGSRIAEEVQRLGDSTGEPPAASDVIASLVPAADADGLWLMPALQELLTLEVSTAAQTVSSLHWPEVSDLRGIASVLVALGIRHGKSRQSHSAEVVWGYSHQNALDFEPGEIPTNQWFRVRRLSNVAFAHSEWPPE